MTAREALDRIERENDELVFECGLTYNENPYEKEIETIREELNKAEALQEFAEFICKKLKIYEHISLDGKKYLLSTPVKDFELTLKQFLKFQEFFTEEDESLVGYFMKGTWTK